MKPVDIKSSTYIYFNKKDNEKYPKFKIDDIVKRSKYKHFCKKVILQIFLNKFLRLLVIVKC